MQEGRDTDLPAWLQVSFFRSNLTFGIVDKRRMVPSDKKTHEGHALIDYIKCAPQAAQGSACALQLQAVAKLPTGCAIYALQHDLATIQGCLSHAGGSLGRAA